MILPELLVSPTAHSHATGVQSSHLPGPHSSTEWCMDTGEGPFARRHVLAAAHRGGPSLSTDLTRREHTHARSQGHSHTSSLSAASGLSDHRLIKEASGSHSRDEADSNRHTRQRHPNRTETEHTGAITRRLVARPPEVAPRPRSRTSSVGDRRSSEIAPRPSEIAPRPSEIALHPRSRTSSGGDRTSSIGDRISSEPSPARPSHRACCLAERAVRVGPPHRRSQP